MLKVPSPNFGLYFNSSFAIKSYYFTYILFVMGSLFFFTLLLEFRHNIYVYKSSEQFYDFNQILCLPTIKE